MLDLIFAGESDIGFEREINEDHVHGRVIAPGVIFAAVADGMGSTPGTLQPAIIAVNEMAQMLSRVAGDAEGLPAIRSYPALFLTEALHLANRVIGAFKMGDEEKRSGYGACTTCALFLAEEKKFCFVHTGNTRFYLIRKNTDGLLNIRQLSTDHTKAAKLYYSGSIDEAAYHTHPDILTITSGVGIAAMPEIQVYDAAKLRNDDIFLMTTDGIHNSIRPEAMLDIIVEAGGCAAAAKSLVKASVMLKAMRDNMSAMLIYAKGEVK